MKSASREIHRLLHRASPVRLVMVFLFLLLMLPLSLAIRYYAVESILVDDAALAPEIDEKTFGVFCKLPSCIETLKEGDFVLFRLSDRTLAIRKILALPGSRVRFFASGFVSINDSTPRSVANEGVFIADREFYVPAAGDTLVIDELSDVEFDYALNLLKQQGIFFSVEAKPYLGDEELPLEYAGNTRIGSRPTSIRELPGLPWQELFLIAHQIRRNLHTTQMVHFNRSIYDAEKIVPVKKEVWSVEPDSQMLDALDVGETDYTVRGSIEAIAVGDDMFYVITPNLNRAQDSREFGYIPRSKIIGKLVFKCGSKDLKLHELKPYYLKARTFLQNLI